MNKIKEKILLFIVYRLPKSIIYFSAIRLMDNATKGKYSSQVVPELKVIEALERWENE